MLQNKQLSDGLTDKAWHALDVSEIVSNLHTELGNGLSNAEASERLNQFGRNLIATPPKVSLTHRLRKQLGQPLILVLLGAGLVTAVLGEWVDSSVIFGVVLVNCLLGIVQEQKAESALAALANILTSEVVVVRDGRPTRLDSQLIVPGDLVLLSSGDKIPADIRLVLTNEFQTSEAILTGESLPVHKSSSILPSDTLVADQTNTAFAGTLVTKGQATGIVIATGRSTQTGRISNLLAGVTKLSTPLTRKLEHFSKWLLIAILAISAVTFGIGLLRAEPWIDMLMASVALAVGAIPEGLPAVISITFAIGVSRMARQRAIIRNLSAVETLGSVTVICSDKTGTLTENRMMVQQIWTDSGMHTVSGSGYGKKGQIKRDGNDVSITSDLRELLIAGVLCNDAALEHAADQWTGIGDPTETALLVLAAKAKLDGQTLKQAFPRHAFLPFDAERKAMATLHNIDGARVIYVKGAWEVLIERCSTQLNALGEEIALSKEAKVAAQKMAQAGMRVLALARSEVFDNLSLDDKHISGNLVLLGFVGIIDPPRPHVKTSIHACHQAGISVKMITGDHPATAHAIAIQLGLVDSEAKVIRGDELARMTPDQIQAVVSQCDVFARITPDQKLDIVRALQSRGEIVAMTGDGVNDAPALRQAEIGVAMGLGGTEVAREAADVVLTDDNFSTIEAAIRQGRTIYDNLVKFIAWTIPTNAGEGLIILAAVSFGTLLPITPLQILWINMMTAIFLGTALAVEPAEDGVMNRPPRNPKASIFDRFLLFQTFLVSILMLSAAFGLFEWALQNDRPLAEARTLATNVFVMIEIAYLFSVKNLTKPIQFNALFENRWMLGGCVFMIALQLGLTYLPILNVTFSTSPLRLSDWVVIVLCGLVSLVVIEMKKWISSIVTFRAHEST